MVLETRGGRLEAPLRITWGLRPASGAPYERRGAVRGAGGEEGLGGEPNDGQELFQLVQGRVEALHLPEARLDLQDAISGFI